jgi:methionyl-tRNA formyltransferase
MNFKDLRIVFLGTPEFARASLQVLHEAGCNIVGVVTAPDKPAGRGMKMHHSAVKEYAAEQGLKLLQPEKLKYHEFLHELASLKADLQVVVAFRMLPDQVWKMPPMGTVNLHASLLPEYRGAAPINWAVINGEETTGLTTFKLQHHIDTGNMLLQEEVSIGPDETAGELHDRMMVTGAELLLETIKGLAEGTLTEEPQEHSTHHKHAPKIYTDTCRITWNKTVEEVYNLIRGLSPFPTAFTIFHQKILKIYSAEKEITPVTGEPGDYTIEKGRIRFTCTNGYIYPKIVQAEGKKKMPAEDFIRGLRIS